MYSISLRPYIYNVSGSIITKEGRQQGYDISFEMNVINAVRFMEMYHHNQNPASWIATQFKDAFEYYTIRLDNVMEVRSWLEKRIIMLSQECGLSIVHPTWWFHASEKGQNGAVKNEDLQQILLRRKQEMEREYALKLHEARLKRDLEREQKEFSRQEKAKQNDFARGEQKKTYVLNEQIKLLSSTVSNLIQINTDRVSESLGYNLPAQEILKDSLKLLASLNNSLENSSQEAEIIADKFLSHETISADSEEEDEPEGDEFSNTSSTLMESD